jgi:class 3 adenylate cyclase/tetratricopeptide (TPR) repeat protein
VADTVVCPACSQENAAEQRFCGSCGARLARECTNCGSPNPLTFRFCGSCGDPLEPREPVRSEERRWATVLFADLGGFTALSERMDPEDVRTLIDSCMTKLGEIVMSYGGFVERVTGDEMMALFGAPVAHEDDPERAVRAALELQQCATEHAPSFGGLPLRVGVNTGEMMFAPVGPEGARQFTVMGDAVNTASRLQSAAPGGGVLVGEETFLATRAAIRYEPMPPFHAKGKEEPVRAWLALDTPATPSARPVSTVALVGRDAELGMLSTIWRRVTSERTPQLVTLLGPPGIGKTRLSRELAAAVIAQRGQALNGRCLPYGERTGYGAFAQQVKQAAGIFETDSVPQAREKLTALVHEVLPDDEAAEIADHAAIIVGLGAGTSADRGPLFFSVRRLVEAIARRAPALFVFEDIHWADAALLDLIESLASRVREAPVLFLTLARPELLDARSSWGGGLASYTALPLGALSADEARALVERLLPVRSAQAAVRLAETSGGNPLFIEELAASLSESAAEAIGELPTNVKAIIAARLDALPAAERTTILDASVIGKIFWRGALTRLAPDLDIDATLEQLERRDFIRREPSSRMQGDREYSFKHILIREVAYGTLPKAARRDRHASAARFIERAAGDRVTESASLLAHHWLEAGDDARALDYLLQAAEHAKRAWAAAEAVGLYDRALEVIGADDHARRSDVLLRRATTIAESGDLKTAADELDRLLPGLGGAQRCEALYVRATAAFWLVDAAGTVRFANLLAEEADATGQEDYRALALASLSQAASIDGALEESMALGDRALALWRPGQRQAERSILLGFQGIDSYWMGRYEQAVERLDEAWRLAQELNSLVGFLQNAPVVSLALAGLGRHEEAIAHGEWTVARARELEFVPRWTARALNMLAGVLHEVFDSDRARGLNEEATELGRVAGFPTAAVQARTDLIYADLRSGNVDTADRAWPLVWDESATLSGWHEWLVRGRLLQAKAELLLAQGRTDAAVDAAAESIAFHMRYPRAKYEAAGRITLGCALCACGRIDEARSELRRALAIAQELRHPPPIWQCEAQLANVLAAAGDDDGATAHAVRARKAVMDLSRTLDATRRQRFLASPAVADVINAGP